MECLTMFCTPAITNYQYVQVWLCPIYWLFIFWFREYLHLTKVTKYQRQNLLSHSLTHAHVYHLDYSRYTYAFSAGVFEVQHKNLFLQLLFLLFDRWLFIWCTGHILVWALILTKTLVSPQSEGTVITPLDILL